MVVVNKFSCRGRDLIGVHKGTLSGVSAEFSKKVTDCFNRISTWIAPGDEIETSMFFFRTCTDREYLTNNNAIHAATIESWRVYDKFRSGDVCMAEDIVGGEIRYLRKTSSYWTAWVTNDRQLRSKHGRIIPHQCHVTFGL